MKVSIIIPVYNAEKYLEECLDSAINQTYQNLEIIAVNDGSTDNSLGILQKYSDKIKIVSKQNGGTASAFNAGVRIATGEWIKWLAADDVLYHDAVEQLVNQARNLPNKINTILYANYDLIDSKGKIIGRRILPNYNNLDQFDFNVILLDHFIGNQDTVLIHRDTLNKYGMFNETISQEDYELHLRCCLIHHCRLQLVNKVVAKYRIHKAQISRANAKKSWREEKMKEEVLSKLSPTELKSYKNALTKYKKNRPLQKKMLRFLGNIAFQFLPSSISTRIWILFQKSR